MSCWKTLANLVKLSKCKSCPAVLYCSSWSQMETLISPVQASKDGKTSKMQERNFLTQYVKLGISLWVLNLLNVFKGPKMFNVYSFLCSRQLHVGDLLLTVFVSPGDFSDCARYQVCVLRPLYPMLASNINISISSIGFMIIITINCFSALAYSVFACVMIYHDISI